MIGLGLHGVGAAGSTNVFDPYDIEDMKYWFDPHNIVKVDSDISIDEAGTDVSANLINKGSHGMQIGTPVLFNRTSNTTVGGVVLETAAANNVGGSYYISETGFDTDSFQLSATPGGAAAGDITLGGLDDPAISILIRGKVDSWKDKAKQEMKRRGA